MMFLSSCVHQSNIEPGIISGYNHIVYPGELLLYHPKNIVKNDESYSVIVNGRYFYVYGKAVKPSIQGLFFIENTRINEGDVVLDIGTGVGLQAVFAADKAKHIIATDIGKDAVRSAIVNVKRFGLEDKIDVRQGDLFEPLKKGEQFDVIINNITYPDEGYDESDPLWKVHERFFREVKNYLKKDGKIYYQSGFFYNLPRINMILKNNNLRISEMKMMFSESYNKEIIVYTIRRRRY